MTYQERLEEAKRLEQENRILLSTPLMSEGTISPMQVGMFSRRQKERWQKNGMAKMALEASIRRLRLTDDELAEIQHRKDEDAKKQLEAQRIIYQSKINFIEGLGRMSHKENGHLKFPYQRTIDQYKIELAKL